MPAEGYSLQRMRPVIYPISTIGAGQLSVMARPSGELDLEAELRGLRHQSVEHVVSLLEADEASDLGLADEGPLCSRLGLGFTGFPITDFDIPTRRENAIELVETLYGEIFSGAHVVIHCRAGIGRTGLIACALLVRDGLSPGEAMHKASFARGAPMPITGEQVEWVESLKGIVWSKGGPR